MTEQTTPKPATADELDASITKALLIPFDKMTREQVMELRTLKDQRHNLDQKRLKALADLAPKAAT